MIYGEKEMATHSSSLAWRILWTEESGGLLSLGSHRARHVWSDLACIHALEKEMATHYSILAWRVPGTEEPGGLPSVWSQRLRHDWSDLVAAAMILWHIIGEVVKNLPAMLETLAWSLGEEDLLEKGMATHSSILAWRIPWIEELGGYCPWVAKSRTPLSDYLPYLTYHL